MVSRVIGSLSETGPGLIALQQNDPEPGQQEREGSGDRPTSDARGSAWKRFLHIFDRVLGVDKRPADEADDEHFRNWGP